jgi:hypothetical protein
MSVHDDKMFMNVERMKYLNNDTKFSEELLFFVRLPIMSITVVT